MSQEQFKPEHNNTIAKKVLAGVGTGAMLFALNAPEAMANDTQPRMSYEQTVQKLEGLPESIHDLTLNLWGPVANQTKRGNRVVTSSTFELDGTIFTIKYTHPNQPLSLDIAPNTAADFQIEELKDGKAVRSLVLLLSEDGTWAGVATEGKKVFTHLNQELSPITSETNQFLGVADELIGNATVANETYRK